ncbi:hypothetical protein HPB47_016605 [Ixodes persulcatus]|uniref:Uncharacterized protein n=1 Tax=Ixodes persulcatus TaxID=34615 RepID=A0AC60QQH6_IXOPE|nr:hypothetical protein HPB47_016605 [Ixodes persulcatus]
MEALLCFVVATLVFLLLFDYYCHQQESQERAPVRSASCDDAPPVKTSRYYSTSLFAILGLSREEVYDFAAFRDRFHTFSEVSTAMRRAGLPDIHVIVGIDFSASNEWQGRKTFRGESLHALKGSNPHNPYQRALASLGAVLTPLLHGNPIPAFGFGDSVTKDAAVFPLIESGTPCLDFNDLMCAYTHTAQKVQLSGPTSLAPLLQKAQEIAAHSREFHVVLVLTDGQLDPAGEASSRRAVVSCSQLPLSLVLVALGDGPWPALQRWDDELPERRFDNLQLVRHAEVTRGCRNPDAALALHALMEVPDQYRAAVQLGLLKS